MDIGVGLDPTLGLNWDEQRTIVREAAELGYTSAWSNSNATGRDSFLICAHWWNASTAVVPEGIETGIAVVPAPAWSAPTLASSAATVGDLTGGRFILGIGTGSSYTEAFRRSYDLPEMPPISTMRDYLKIVRGMLAGEKVDYQGKVISIHGLSLGFKPPKVPVYLAALGPQMMRLAGEAADGVCLNWCSVDQVAWSRELVTEGARKAGRDPSEVKISEWIRVCVDDDVDTARKALAKATLGYAIARPGSPKTMGYRGHFGRMGFEEVLTELEARRDRGEKEEDLANDLPDDLLLKVGYFGKPDGAAAAFARLAEGLDLRTVRVVAARPGIDSVRAVIRACAPKEVTSAVRV